LTGAKPNKRNQIRRGGPHRKKNAHAKMGKPSKTPKNRPARKRTKKVRFRWGQFSIEEGEGLRKRRRRNTESTENGLIKIHPGNPDLEEQQPGHEDFKY